MIAYKIQSAKRENLLALYVLFAYFLTLYFMPYFRVRYEFPRYFALREILVCVLVVMALKAGRIIPRFPPWLWLMVLAYVMGTLMSNSVGIAFYTLQTLLQFVFVYVFSALFVRSEHAFLMGCRFFMVMGFLALGMILAQLAIGPMERLNIYPSFDLASQRFGLIRLGSIFGNPITTCIMLLILLWQLAFYIKKKVIRWTLIATVCIASVFTFSIGPLFIISISVCLIALGRSFLISHISLRSVIIIISIVFFFTVLLIQYEHRFDATIIYDESLSEFVMEELENRLITKFDEGYEIIKSRGFHSIFMGCGFDAAGQASMLYNPYSGFRPHNFFLEVAVTMGVVGLLAYVLFICELSLRSMKIKAHTQAQVWAKGMGLGLMAAFVSAILVDLHLTNIIMVPAFFLISSMRNLPTIFIRNTCQSLRPMKIHEIVKS